MAVELVESYFPTEGYLRHGQIGFDHICKDYTGGGTTCGFLPFWIWWHMGCRDAKLINRYEPDTGCTYKDGANMSRMHAHNAFVHLDSSKANNVAFLNSTIFPRRGDAIMIKGQGDSEHVFVVLDEGSWETATAGTWRIAETGQKNQGVEAGHIADHSVEYKGGKWMIGKRWMLGWLDLDKVRFDKPPVAEDRLADYSEATAAKSLIQRVKGIWRVKTTAGTVWYYMFLKGFRVFWALGQQPKLIQNGGYWIPQNDQVTIYWDDGGVESMWPSSDKAASGNADNQFDWNAVKVSMDGTIMHSFHNSSGIGMGAAV